MLYILMLWYIVERKILSSIWLVTGKQVKYRQYLYEILVHTNNEQICFDHFCRSIIQTTYNRITHNDVQTHAHYEASHKRMYKKKRTAFMVILLYTSIHINPLHILLNTKMTASLPKTMIISDSM